MSTQTLDRQEVPVTSDRSPRSIPSVIGVLLAVLLMLAGVGVGWLVWSGDDPVRSPTPLYVGSASGDVVRYAGKGNVIDVALTDRQLEMVQVTKRYVEAWIAKDGDAVASFLAPDGFVKLPELGRTMDAKQLADWVARIGAIPNELNDPMMVFEHRVVLTGRYDPLSAAWLMVIEFTRTGDVKIVSDTHWAF